MNDHPLPPLVGEFNQGKVTWERLESVDYGLLGYLLSCHLIIEHYMDHFLATIPGIPELGWKGAKLSFGQKISLISTIKFTEPYHLPPLIKHLNSLRNRFGHNINTRLTDDDLLPLKQFLERCVKGNESVPSDAKEILHAFTMVVCAYMASLISFNARFASPNAERPA